LTAQIELVVSGYSGHAASGGRTAGVRPSNGPTPLRGRISSVSSRTRRAIARPATGRPGPVRTELNAQALEFGGDRLGFVHVHRTRGRAGRPTAGAATRFRNGTSPS